jgi:hypothetical protein
MPLYIGGPDVSNQGGATTNSTTNSTTNTDNSRITNTSTVLDGGAIGMAQQVALATIAGAGTNQVHAYDYADNVFHGALDFAQANDTRAYNAFDRAAVMQETAIGQLQGAYADAKGTTAAQTNIIYGVLAVAGVAVMMAMKARA